MPSAASCRRRRLTWKFFRNGAASEKIEDGADFARLIDRWMADRRNLRRVRENFLKLRYEEDPTRADRRTRRPRQRGGRAKLKRRAFPPAGNGERPRAPDTVPQDVSVAGHVIRLAASPRAAL
jgi:hypothetical protein